MSAPSAPQLAVQSDLHLAVGDLHATLVAAGTLLTLHTPDAAAMMRQAGAVAPTVVPRPPWRRLVSRTSRSLGEAGLTLRIEDDHGTVADLGHGCDSRVLRALGIEQVRPGSLRVLAPLVVRQVAAAPGPSRRAVVATAGLAVAALVVAARRRGPDGSCPP